MRVSTCGRIALVLAVSLCINTPVARAQYTKLMSCNANAFPDGPTVITTGTTLPLTQMCTLAPPPSTEPCIGDTIMVTMPKCTNPLYNDLFIIAQSSGENLTDAYNDAEFPVTLTRVIAQWTNLGEPLNGAGCPAFSGKLTGPDFQGFAPDFVVGIYGTCAYNPITSPNGAGQLCGNGTVEVSYIRSPNAAACAQPPPPGGTYAPYPPSPPPHPPISLGPTGVAPPAPPTAYRLSPPPSPPSPPSPPLPPSPPAKSPPPPSPKPPPPGPPSPPPRPPPRPPPPRPPPSPPHYLGKYGCNARADADCKACGGKIHPASCDCLCPFSKWESIVLAHIGFLLVSIFMLF